MSPPATGAVTGRRADHTRTSRIVLTGLWADAALVMAASAYNGGQAFAALGQQTGAGIALGLAVDVGLAVALIGDRALHLAGRSSQWGRALRVCTAIMSLALNCAVALWMGHYGVAVFHAFLPVLLILLSEYAQDSTLQFGEIAAEHAAALKAEQDAQLAAARATQQPSAPRPAMAPIPPPAPAPFHAVPPRLSPRPDFTPAVQPAGQPSGQPAPHPTEQPAGRPTGQPADLASGRPTTTTRITPPGRPVTTTPRRTRPVRTRRTGKPKTDQQLAAGIRELTQRNGGRPPSQYQLRHFLGVGGPRAARLLAELNTTSPAEPAADNGAATSKEEPTR
ncbi:MAG TPA: PT domain-containing protein [Pseudonocardiaceae bacterium]|nr:PT domain-containing protein [Pseudonocardiaceae bacterium]